MAIIKGSILHRNPETRFIFCMKLQYGFTAEILSACCYIYALDSFTLPLECEVNSASISVDMKLKIKFA